MSIGYFIHLRLKQTYDVILSLLTVIWLPDTSYHDVTLTLFWILIVLV
jgi:hypothetical protein